MAPPFLPLQSRPTFDLSVVPARQEEAEAPRPAAELVQGAMGHAWVKDFQRMAGLSPAEAQSVLNAHLADIEADFQNLRALRGMGSFRHDGQTLRGPLDEVSDASLAAQVVLSYLISQRTGIPARLIMAIALEESQMDPTAGKGSGTGPYQLTPICVYDCTTQRLERANKRMQAYGHKALPVGIANIWDSASGRWSGTAIAVAKRGGGYTWSASGKKAAQHPGHAGLIAALELYQKGFDPTQTAPDSLRAALAAYNSTDRKAQYAKEVLAFYDILQAPKSLAALSKRA